MKSSSQRAALRRLLLAINLLLFTALLGAGIPPATHAKAKPKPDAQTEAESDEPPAQPDIGVVFDPAEGDLEQGNTLHVSFPGAMVKPDLIDAGNQPSPVRFDPPVEGKWFWKSQTDGEFEVTGGLRPGQKYKVTLAPGLKLLDGQPLQAPAGWIGATFSTTEFTVATEFNEKERLAGLPGVVLSFTYPVRLSDAADHIWFQDRESLKRFPAELSLREEDNERDLPTGRVVRVSPRDGQVLPLGRTYDLIVDAGMRDAVGGQPLAYLRRFPLGHTAPLEITWLGAFNHSLEKPAVRAKFDDVIDPETVKADALSFEPAVKNLKLRAEGDEVIADGEFDVKTRYKVVVNPNVKGARGYGLAEPGRWRATFQPKPAALFFPGPRIYQRARLGLHFSFLQVNTGALRWRLAAVPWVKFAAVQARLREFEKAKKDLLTGKNLADPDTGNDVPQPTELLTDLFALPVRASGAFPASGDDAETVREVAWQPAANETPSGLFLLEVSGPAENNGGRTVGHRSLVVFSDAIITQKENAEGITARVAGMDDGLPRPGVKVRAVSRSNYEVASATTDADGLVRFTTADLHPDKKDRGGEPAEMLIAETKTGPALQFLDASAFDSVYIPSEPPPATQLRSKILTDRPLYRPGHTVKMLGLARIAERGTGKDAGPERLRSPAAGSKVSWNITQGYESQSVAEGEATITAAGGWEAEWTIPESGKLGRHVLHCTIGGMEATGSGATVEFQVQEYKTPLFEVKAKADADPAPGKSDAAAALLRVDANYFSGQPVVGAKVAWSVRWERNDAYASPQAENKNADSENSGDDDSGSSSTTTSDWRLDDGYSENHKPLGDDPPPTKGDTVLDKDGSAVLRVPPPPNLPGARYRAYWTIAVTSADGQSVSPSDNESVSSTVMLQPALLGLRDDAPEAGGANEKRLISVKTALFNVKDQPADDKADAGVKLDVFRVTTKTAKERVAPFVFRYRNTSVYNPVKSATLPKAGAGAFELPVTEPGRYVVVASAPNLRNPASVEIFITGAEPDEVPVTNDTSLEAHAEKSEYAPGQTAAFITRSPVSGVAWVSVETDRILDTLLVRLPGNTSRIELPVKPEYAPNAKVAIYLVRPGGNDKLPAERYARAELRVARPDLKLEVTPRFEKPSVRPGERVVGSVEVRSAGAAVNGADVSVYAVDDAVLALGDWKEPEVFGPFYPSRPHRVKTYGALRDYVASIERKSLFNKGFVIGGGGEEFGSKFVRKDFRPLALWQTKLRTDAAGRVPFEFTAPDNLTRYRLVAIVQTNANQFGEGNAVVEVAKPLQLEPSLPRFLRVGDTVELRAVARQSARDKDAISVSCVTDAGLVLADPNGAAAPPVPAAKNAPAVFRFKAKVGEVTGVKVTFTASSASDPSLSDSVEITLPVLPPTVLRRESVAGTFNPAASTTAPDIAALLPANWKRAATGGHFDLAFSTSPSLPRLQGLPAILEYPHGCFEQISTRVLAYVALDALWASVPTDGAQNEAWRAIIERQLRLFDNSLLSDGSLPYWPGGKEPNSFVTIQALWAVNRAAGADFSVPEGLGEKLNKAVDKIIAGRSGSNRDTAWIRAFALLVQPAAEGNSDAREQAAKDLYLNRETLGDEGRALLALALKANDTMPKEALQLLRELDTTALTSTKGRSPRAFNPATFSSDVRAEAVTLLALTAVHPPFWDAKKQAAARARLDALMDHAPLLSTQENLWTLMAYGGLHDADKSPKLKIAGTPRPGRISKDGTAAAWVNNDLARSGAELRLNGLAAATPGSGNASAPLYYLLGAEYRLANPEEEARTDRGLRVERVVRNLTDAARTGADGAPAIKLNDRLLVTYRLAGAKLRSYVALDDELPAGLELINPDLTMFAGFYEIPPPANGERRLELSHSELRDQKASLYFDRVDPGIATCSVLVRAVAAGDFRWPSTQATPMYDPSVSGLTPAANLVVEP